MGFLNLPHELLRLIFSQVGWENKFYSFREKQNDLCAFCLTHPACVGPATDLLYSEPTVRNAGRAHLIDRTLAARSDLANKVQSLNCPSNTSQDPGRPGIVVSILARMQPTKILLGQALFLHGEESHNLVKLLTQRKNIQSFYLGEDQKSKTGVSPPYFSHVVELLIAWHSLQDLTIVDCKHGYSGTLDLLIKPCYGLHSLAIVSSVLFQETIEWILGESRTLQKLTLRDCHIRILGRGADWVEQDGMYSSIDPPLLAGLLDSLEALDLDQVSLRTKGLPVQAANALLRQCPKLLTLSFTDQLKTGGKIDFKLLPRTLRRLEIGGSVDIFDTYDFVNDLEAQIIPESLDCLVFRLPSTTHPKLVELKAICKSRSIRLEVQMIITKR